MRASASESDHGLVDTYLRCRSPVQSGNTLDVLVPFVYLVEDQASRDVGIGILCTEIPIQQLEAVSGHESGDRMVRSFRRRIPIKGNSRHGENSHVD